MQNYAWGKLGLESAVARLHAQKNKVDETSPYGKALSPSPSPSPSPSLISTPSPSPSCTRVAELWMGTHPNGPSRVVGETGAASATLKEHIGAGLPYLFKVLSVNKALSIQAHPDKSLAEELHADRPNVYKDPNHKPEMAIAVTRFEAMCGFRPMHEIALFLESVPGTHRQHSYVFTIVPSIITIVCMSSKSSSQLINFCCDRTSCLDWRGSVCRFQRGDSKWRRHKSGSS